MRQFTLVSTIFNEAARLQESIEDIENQTVPPNEIVVVDAGSNDGTVELLNKWKAQSSINILIIIKPKCNVAEGRNIAIKRASYDLIVSTDFGCRYHKLWLESMISPFEDEDVQIVAGNYSVRLEMLSSIASKSAFLLAGGYENVMDEHFIPSSRSVAYYRSVWSAVGGYPEWVTLAGDDTYFGYQLKKMGYSFHLSYTPLVYWGRHLNAKDYDREAFRYGLGDGETKDIVNRKNTLIKLMELILRICFIPSIILIFLMKPALPAILLMIISLMGFRPYLRLFTYWLRTSNEFKFIHFMYALFMLERNRWHYLRGYLKGLKNR